MGRLRLNIYLWLERVLVLEPGRGYIIVDSPSALMCLIQSLDRSHMTWLGRVVVRRVELRAVQLADRVLKLLLLLMFLDLLLLVDVVARQIDVGTMLLLLRILVLDFVALPLLFVLLLAFS